MSKNAKIAEIFHQGLEFMKINGCESDNSVNFFFDRYQPAIFISNVQVFGKLASALKSVQYL